MSSDTAVDSPPTTATTNTPMRRTVAITAVTALVVVGQLYAPIPLLTDIGTQLHVSAATAAWVSAIFGFGYAIGMLVAGPLSDTLGRRRIVVAGLVAAAITTGIVALAPTFPVLLISRALQGGAAAFFPPVALAYLTERIAPAQRTMALTVTISSFLMAAVVAPLVAAGLAEIGGWRSWFVVSTPALLALAAVNRVVLRADHTTSTSVAVRTALLRLPALLRHPRLLGLYLTTLTVMWVYVGITTLTQLAGPGTATDPAAMQLVRLAVLPTFVFVVLATPLLGRLRGPTRLVAALTVATIAVAATSITGGPVTLALTLAVTTAGVAVIAPAMVETIGATSPAEQRGAATAVYGCTLFLGASLAAPTATALKPAGFTVGSLVLAGILAVGCCAAVLATRRS